MNNTKVSAPVVPPKKRQTKKQTNLYLETDLRAKAKPVILRRYNISESAFFNGIYRQELESKKGVLKAEFIRA